MVSKVRIHRKLIDRNRQKTLRAEGWALSEAKKLVSGLKASGGSMTEAVFWAMRQSRVEWYNARIQDGWTRGQIMASIRRYYVGRRYDPWKEYRAQYAGYPGGDYTSPHPFRGNNFPANYRAAVAKRKSDRKSVDVMVKGKKISF